MNKLLNIVAVLVDGERRAPGWLRNFGAIAAAKVLAVLLLLAAGGFGVAAGYLALSGWIGAPLAAVATAGALAFMASSVFLIAARLARPGRETAHEPPVRQEAEYRPSPQAAEPMAEIGRLLGREATQFAERRPLSAVSIAFIAGLLLTGSERVIVQKRERS